MYQKILSFFISVGLFISSLQKFKTNKFIDGFNRMKDPFKEWRGYAHLPNLIGNSLAFVSLIHN
jgi:hypothetical protein